LFEVKVFVKVCLFPIFIFN